MTPKEIKKWIRELKQIEREEKSAESFTSGMIYALEISLRHNDKRITKKAKK